MLTLNLPVPEDRYCDHCFRMIRGRSDPSFYLDDGADTELCPTCYKKWERNQELVELWMLDTLLEDIDVSL